MGKGARTRGPHELSPLPAAGGYLALGEMQTSGLKESCR